MKLSLTEQLSYSTVRIVVEDKESRLSFGSGYFFRFKDNKENNLHIPVVITNKHVIKNQIKGKLIFTTADDYNNPIDDEHFEIFVEKFESFWKMHPDPEVDLCAMPIAPFLNEAKKYKRNLFYLPLDKSIIPSDDQLNNLTAVEDILMVGYPNGIWDEINNKPIFRKGITATHPSYDYNGKKEIIIDMPSFPGSSGSPVFLYNQSGYTDKMKNTFFHGSRIFLLGTLYATFLSEASGEIKIIEVPTLQKPIVISNIPNNLGLIIKSCRILEIEALF